MHNTNELLEQFESLAIETIDCIPFRPALSPHWQHLQLADIPRYLFRVYTPKSDGSMDGAWAKSRDAVSGLPSAKEDIFQCHSPAIYELTAHLRWYRRPRNDNFVSWTSSILFAIQYMFFRHRMPEDSSSLEDVMLCIVDTTKFEPAVFIRDLDLIVPFATDNKYLERFKSLRTGGTHYYGEYLSQGALKIQDKCQTVSARAMLDCGLNLLSDHFSPSLQGENQWAIPVTEIRKQLSSCEALLHSIRTPPMHIALTISQLFGRSWRLPVAINLLALLPGSLNVSKIKKLLVDGQLFEDIEFGECDRTVIIPYDEMPEVVRAEQIRRIVSTGRHERQIEELLREAESSIRRATMSVIAIKDDVHSISNARRSRFLNRAHQVASVAEGLSDLMEEHFGHQV